MGKKNKMREEDVLLIFMLMGIVFMFTMVFFAIFVIYVTIKSKKFHEITKLPRYPNWMHKFDVVSFHKEELKHFTTYTKPYTIRTYEEKGKTKECSKKMMKNIRNFLQDHFQLSVDSRSIPDSTCLISIPKKNFKCRSRPTTFTPIHGEPEESFYEYQMIGDNRMQVTYFNVNGVRFVAGICIYFQDPYQAPLHYQIPIIETFLSKPTYWSKHNLKEETMMIMAKKSTNKLTLMTNNRYGERRHFQFNGEKRAFESQSLLPEYLFKSVIKNIELESVQVDICKLRNEFVMISFKNGRKLHATWNNRSNRLDFEECELCSKPDDDEPPPPYHSIQF